MNRPSDQVDAFIAVGANVAPEEHILRGLSLLQEEVAIVGVSTFYWTPPLGRPEQPDYLNGIVHVRTRLSAQAFKRDVLEGVEAALGRVRSADAYAAREIDLDIAVFGGFVVAERRLRIPSPDVRKRAFVAVPLLELAPNLRLPDSGELLADVVAALGRSELRAAAEFTERLKARLQV